MNLFVFFVLPLATILLAIVLQKILHSPILVAITFFAIYLIVAFVSFSGTLAEAIIAVIIYTLIAYVTALIIQLLKRYYCLNSRIIQENNSLNMINQDNVNYVNENTGNNILSSKNLCTLNSANETEREGTEMHHYIRSIPAAYGNSYVNRRYYKR